MPTWKEESLWDPESQAKTVAWRDQFQNRTELESSSRHILSVFTYSLLYLFLWVLLCCLFSLNLCFKIPSFSALVQNISAGKRIQVQVVVPCGFSSMPDPEALLYRTAAVSARWSASQWEPKDNSLSPCSAGPSTRDAVHLMLSSEESQVLVECLSNLF